MPLRDSIIKLAHEEPKLRRYLIPLLRTARESHPYDFYDDWINDAKSYREARIIIKTLRKDSGLGERQKEKLVRQLVGFSSFWNTDRYGGLSDALQDAGWEHLSQVD